MHRSRRSLLTAAVAATGAAFGDTSTLRVRVVDTIGAAVPEASVTLLVHQNAKQPPSNKPNTPTVLAIRTTGKDGVVEFPAAKSARFTVEVRAYGFQPWTQGNVRLSKTPLEAVLQVGFLVLY